MLGEIGIGQDNTAGHLRFAVEKRGGKDLAARRKTDAEMASIAARLRSQKVMTPGWIAKRLKMGCRHTAANFLKKISNSRD